MIDVLTFDQSDSGFIDIHHDTFLLKSLYTLDYHEWNEQIACRYFDIYGFHAISMRSANKT